MSYRVQASWPGHDNQGNPAQPILFRVIRVIRVIQKPGTPSSRSEPARRSMRCVLCLGLRRMLLLNMLPLVCAVPSSAPCPRLRRAVVCILFAPGRAGPTAVHAVQPATARACAAQWRAAHRRIRRAVASVASVAAQCAGPAPHLIRCLLAWAAQCAGPGTLVSPMPSSNMRRSVEAAIAQRMRDRRCAALSRQWWKCRCSRRTRGRCSARKGQSHSPRLLVDDKDHK